MKRAASRRGVLRLGAGLGAGLGAISGGLAAGVAGPPDRAKAGVGAVGGRGRLSGVQAGVGAVAAGAAGAVLPGNYVPFTQPCAIPLELEPTSEGVAPWQPGAVFHGIAPEFFNRRYAEFPEIPFYEIHPTRYFDLRVRPRFLNVACSNAFPLFALPLPSNENTT